MNRSILIRKSDIARAILAFVLVFPFIEVNAYESVSFISVSQVQDILAVALVIPVSIIYLKNYGKCKHIALWGLLFLAAVVLCTLVSNPRQLYSAVFYGIRMFTFLEIVDLYLSLENDMILAVLDVYLCFLFGMTFYYQLVDQSHWGHSDAVNFNNFFVGDNELPFYTITHLAIIIARRHGKLKLIDFAKMLLEILILIKAWCASGIITMVACVLIILFEFLGKYTFRFTVRRQIIMMAAIYFMLFSNMTISFVNNITMRIFNKSIESARLRIWRKAIENIKKSVTFGHGTARGGRLAINYVSYPGGGKYWFSHNFSLEYLIQGGLILFSVYLILIIICLIASEKYTSKTLNLLLIALLGIHIAGITEAWIMNPFFYLVYVTIFFAENYCEKANALDESLLKAS